MKVSAVIIATLALSACAKQHSNEPSAKSAQAASGSENSAATTAPAPSSPSAQVPQAPAADDVNAAAATPNTPYDNVQRSTAEQAGIYEPGAEPDLSALPDESAGQAAATNKSDMVGRDQYGGAVTSPYVASSPDNQGMRPEIDVEALRATLIEQRPKDAAEIRRLTIIESNGVVTLRGRLQDEAARPAIVATVEHSPGVVDVKDEMQRTSKKSSTRQ